MKINGRILLVLLCFFNQALALSVPCDANKGLSLLQNNPLPLAEIHLILQACDRKNPNSVQTLLLHGLVARQDAKSTQKYEQAINWLQQAQKVAAKNNDVPTLELAVTYEWAQQPAAAQALYTQLLAKEPQSRPALLGLARTVTAQGDLKQALTLYQQALHNNPQDVDAINGLGRVLLAYKQPDEAERYFQQALAIQPQNPDALIGLQQVVAIRKLNVQADSSIPPLLECDPNQGLTWVNQKPAPIQAIQQILFRCDQEHNRGVQVLLLHGLLERAQQHYPQAIAWLKQALQAAATDNPIPALELALTYEWSHESLTALSIYDSILQQNPTLRPALLGKARVLLGRTRVVDAQNIYQQLLRENAQDVEALNGMGRVELAQRQSARAKAYFQHALQIQPQNTDSLLGITQAQAVQIAKPQALSTKTTPAPAPSLCDPNAGLLLVNQKPLPLAKIQYILSHCNGTQKNEVQVLLLHGLTARAQKDYPAAISWLKLAAQNASATDAVPAQELALTYEWSLQFTQAKRIYDDLLLRNPQDRAALLGKARIAGAEYQMPAARQIYQGLLQQNPNDTDALNGLARLEMMDKRFEEARGYYAQALKINPQNSESLKGLTQLKDSTRYMFSFNQGQYRVLDQHSNSTVLFGYADISATDRVILIGTHNSKQLALDLPIEPSLLPNNGLYAGFQRQLPDRYGWGLNYEFRQHNGYPLETRIGGNANLYLLRNVQVFGGFWRGFPSPWDNQLYFSGLTYYTKLPVNFTVTGFWAQQQFGGRNDSYSFDLSKETTNHKFYALGVSYNNTQRFWGYHGRFIWPTFKNQALEGSYEHYTFNNINIFGLGWRVYWA